MEKLILIKEIFLFFNIDIHREIFFRNRVCTWDCVDCGDRQEDDHARIEVKADGLLDEDGAGVHVHLSVDTNVIISF